MPLARQAAAAAISALASTTALVAFFGNPNTVAEQLRGEIGEILPDQHDEHGDARVPSGGEVCACDDGGEDMSRGQVLLQYCQRAGKTAFYTATSTLSDGGSRTAGKGGKYEQVRAVVLTNAGGGGERVLWAAIAHLQRTEPDVVSVVYTGDTDASKEQIIKKVQERFNINLSPKSLAFVYLKSRYLVDDKTWSHFTLLGQSGGSVLLGWEALQGLVPDIFIDTMGYAFTFFLLRLLGIKSSTGSNSSIPIGAYVHYPTISTDMLARVRDRRASHTNDARVAGSTLRSQAKLLYYRAFAFCYSRSLSLADNIMVNSTWTKNHVDRLLPSVHGVSKGSQYDGSELVYPPCNTDALAKLPLEGRERVILSVAQFRPEKNHMMQLQALRALFDANPDYSSGERKVVLVMLGSARNEEDTQRVEALQRTAHELGLAKNVKFVLNAPYSELLDWLARSSIGLSTMVDEHFGINVVEFMAAGLIPLAHASGGPLLDIVMPLNGELTGFHASTPAEFGERLHEIFSLRKTEELAMRKRARQSSERFGTKEFEKGWAKAWMSLKKSLNP
ncbi:glycosyltransferase family 4 protein [Botryobasidium botryosum FD-172 SS1]|uniref:GDP-Man:Man(3)GlcNAc(2)-PP-Dol alpha-1,2-mannosyltransferase n=1 Tax=Botryobasidium botryosum (strain FD-172 SS1) TaxID=930990 RepID=A0A067N0P4_BOTB1|nr:glycosyltransferase family 4 protein [Botryobasidium botryosum FD-172 SS1]